ncbi:polysaccharide pyruvyl transferase family protein (plasmid) [Pseudobutyrivibrio xylanivorans]|uniref:Polysaccharide pyruvyl transferase family protein n=1 Tax=Pseudobutyrivibrio xylanivorans TaxID=185007 RepID=A0A5P6VW96_PSEXY|nr:polysaccharide pyruvyl transferase family protein [Pseudobutyrivibrio xylanivorans]
MQILQHSYVSNSCYYKNVYLNEEVMKVGIITFHRAVNYGAVLQAYALQYAVEKLGHKAEILDYRCEEVDRAASPLLGFRKGEGFKTATKKLIFRTRKNVSFNSFMKNYIHLSKKAVTHEDLVKLSKEYDSFFTGSDQVWNYGCAGNDKAFFLDFVDEGKRKRLCCKLWNREAV